MSKHRRNPKNGVDTARGIKAVTELLEALGYNSSTAALKQTPERVVKAFEEMTTARDFRISFFDNEKSYHEPLLVSDIPFTSICEHHLLPFRGVAHIGYVPGKKLIGLSVLPYVVEKFAHGLQLQESLTEEISDYLNKNINAKGIAVMIEADHMCMQVRGARSTTAKTVTQAFRGELQKDKLFRSWFYSATNEAEEKGSDCQPENKAS